MMWYLEFSVRSRTKFLLWGTALAVVCLLQAPSLHADGPDLNWDGVTDVTDAQYAANIILQLDFPSRSHQGDVNLSGSVNVTDLQLIISEILGLSPVPVSCVPLSLPMASVGQPWQYKLQGIGGVGGLAWSGSGYPSWMQMSADGWIIGAPTAMQGTVSFNVTAIDSLGSRISASTSLQVGPPNQTPLAIPDHFPMPAGGTLTVPALGVLANDYDADRDHLSASLQTPASQGSVVMSSNGSFTYTSPATPTGLNATFSYTATDGRGGFAQATVYIWFGNCPPRTVEDIAEIVAGTMAGGNQWTTFGGEEVLVNDVDPEMDPLTATVITPPTEGTFSMTSNGRITFTIPRNHPGGEFTYLYAASDGVSPIPAIGLGRIIVVPLQDAFQMIEAKESRGPIQSGTPVTIEAVVTNLGTSLTLAYNNVSSVEIDGAPFGLAAPIPMTFVSFDGRNESNYTATFMTSTTMLYGLQSVTLTATSMTQSVSTSTYFVLAYHGSPLVVGTTHTTVQAAVNACPNFGAVLLPMMPSQTTPVVPYTTNWAASTGLVANKPIVIGVVLPSVISSLERPTIRLPVDWPFFAPNGTHDGLIVQGLVFSNSATSSSFSVPPVSASVTPTPTKINLNTSATFCDVYFSGVRSAGSGGVFRIHGPGVSPYFHGVHFVSVSNEVATSAPLKGGYIWVHSGAGLRGRGCQVVGMQSIVSNSIGPIWGGLLCYEASSGPGLEFDDCNWSIGNTSYPVSGSSGIIGGSTYIDGGTVSALAGSFRSTCQTSPTGKIFGGGLALLGGAQLTMISGSFAGTVSGGSLILGGGLYIAGGSIAVINKAHLSGTVNSVSGGGGAIAMTDNCLVRLEHGRIYASTTGAGGGIWFDTASNDAPQGTSPVARSGGAYLGMFNMSMTCTAGSGGALIHVADSTAVGPMPTISITNSSFTGGSAPVNGGLHFSRGNVTLLDSVIAGCSGTPWFHNPLRGAVTVSHTAAPVGLIPEHNVGTFGNIAALDPTAFGTYSEYYKSLENRGSVSASLRGLENFGFASNYIVDKGQLDIGYHPLSGTYYSQLRFFPLTLPHFTPQQLAVMFP